MRVHEEVRTALDEGRPVVALESTIIAHGLPRPDNLRVAREIEAVVRSGGAVPATIAILGGEVRIGLDDDALEALANTDGVDKCGVRDLPPVLARRGFGATTVAATSHLAERAGIRVFATGGLGGVHRGAADTFDESADLGTLARVGICVVCAGVKSILDIPATLERLETLNVTVLGYRTDTFPAFYLTSSGLPVPWRVDSPREAADVLRARLQVGAPGAVVVANPLDEQMDPDLHARTLREGLAAADAAGIRGRDVTPFVLERFHSGTGGASLRANIRLVLRNAALAAEIAAA
jgi:pseudouridine-5'-phosphate glycosidase